MLKPKFANEIASEMEKILNNDVDHSKDILSAIDYLNSAAEIFDDLELISKSDIVLDIIYKMAIKKKKKSFKDPHTKGLTPDKMVKNLLDHGHPMNKSDDGFVDDETFEDEWVII